MAVETLHITLDKIIMVSVLQCKPVEAIDALNNLSLMAITIFLHVEELCGIDWYDFSKCKHNIFT